ncbi:CapA family protein [Shewanella sp. MMG014]|uniref:CapA family protein n=1 Tax=Shewanella sp. MMG014 TaxID=2822691 RepID=UPI001B37C9F3|nr:CapA family protein [Shewanella sp. MMG014]MBQ4888545.1 CapA family protein [Shewanella sp. MMG014]
MSHKIEVFGDFYSKEKVNFGFDFENNSFVNLECPIIDVMDEFKPESGKVNLSADFEVLSSFSNISTTFTVANNHMLDFGGRGLSSTLRKLDSLGFNYLGTKEIEFVVVEGTNVAVINAVSESSGIKRNGELLFVDSERLKLIVSELKNNYRILLIAHWGDEECKLPRPDEVALAHELIDIGVSCIIGHHAHVIQCAEIYQGKYIFYGIGNLFFPDIDQPSHFEDGIYKRTFKKKQGTQNKKSISIVLNEYLELVQIKKYSFKSNLVSYCGDLKFKSIDKTNLINSPSYFNKYKSSKINGQRKSMISRFLMEPKLSKFVNILKFVKPRGE